jgi:P-type Mg2+ transporter
LLVTAIGIALPYTPVAAPLGLAPLPAAYFLYLVLALGAYLTLVEIVKYGVMRQLRSDGSSPERESRLVLRRA